MTQAGAKPAGHEALGGSKVWSTSTWPPSAPTRSNHEAEAPDLRSVPLSWVPPQKRTGICGTVAIDVNCVIARFVRWVTAVVTGLTVPLRLFQVTALRGSAAVLPPRLSLYQTPPSLPIITCAGLVGLKANAWKSGCWSYPRLIQVWPPSSERKMPPEP